MRSSNVLSILEEEQAYSAPDYYSMLYNHAPSSAPLTNYEPRKIAPRRPIFPDEEEEMLQKPVHNTTASKVALNRETVSSTMSNRIADHIDQVVTSISATSKTTQLSAANNHLSTEQQQNTPNPASAASTAIAQSSQRLSTSAVHPSNINSRADRSDQNAHRVALAEERQDKTQRSVVTSIQSSPDKKGNRLNRNPDNLTALKAQPTSTHVNTQRQSSVHSQTAPTAPSAHECLIRWLIPLLRRVLRVCCSAASIN